MSKNYTLKSKGGFITTFTSEIVNGMMDVVEGH